MAALLFDTSVFVGMETDRPMEPLPRGELAISVMTIGELQLGVQLASPDQLSLRLETLAEAEHRFTALPIDIPVMRRFASIVAACRRRGFRPQVPGAMIAATASHHRLTLVTQDRGFERFEGIDVVYV